MVIKNDPDYEKRKEIEASLQEDEDSKKERLLKQFMEFSPSLILIAFMYAKNFEETGEDITKRWVTAEQQGDALQRYYDKGFNAGYQEGIQKGMEYERKKIEKLDKKIKRDRNDPDSISFDSANRQIKLSRPH